MIPSQSAASLDHQKTTLIESVSTEILVWLHPEFVVASAGKVAGRKATDAELIRQIYTGANVVANILKALDPQLQAEVVSLVAQTLLSIAIDERTSSLYKRISVKATECLQNKLTPDVIQALHDLPIANDIFYCLKLCDKGEAITVYVSAFLFRPDFFQNDAVIKQAEAALIRTAQNDNRRLSQLEFFLDKFPYSQMYGAQRVVPDEVLARLHDELENLLKGGATAKTKAHQYFSCTPAMKLALTDEWAREAILMGLERHLENLNLEGICYHLGLLNDIETAQGIYTVESGEYESIREDGRVASLNSMLKPCERITIYPSLCIFSAQEALCDYIEKADLKRLHYVPATVRSLTENFGIQFFYSASRSASVIASTFERMYVENAPLYLFNSLAELFPVSMRAALIKEERITRYLSALVGRELANLEVVLLEFNPSGHTAEAKQLEKRLNQLSCTLSIFDLPRYFNDTLTQCKTKLGCSHSPFSTFNELRAELETSSRTDISQHVSLSAFAEAVVKEVEPLLSTNLEAANKIAVESLELIRQQTHQPEYWAASATLHDLIAQTLQDAELIAHYHRDASLIRLGWLFPWDLRIANGFDYLGTQCSLHEGSLSDMGKALFAVADVIKSYNINKCYSDEESLGYMQRLHQAYRDLRLTCTQDEELDSAVCSAMFVVSSKT